MPDNVIDTLSINIKSDSAGASRAIDRLITNLTRLNGALENYADASRYGKALGNLQSGIEGLNSSIAKIDTSNLKSAASSIASLATSAQKLNGVFANVGMDKATRDAKALDAEVSKAAKTISSRFGISGEAVGSVKEGLAKMVGLFRLDGDKLKVKGLDLNEATEDLKRTIEQNAKTGLEEGGESGYNGLINYIKGKKISLPFGWRDISGDYSGAVAKASKLFGVGNFDFHGNNRPFDDLVVELDEAFGTNFSSYEDTTIVFEKLYDMAMACAPAMNSFDSSVGRTKLTMSEFNEQVNDVFGSLVNYKAALAQSPDQGVTSPFSAMANDLKSLEGIQIPDLTGVANLAGNIGKLANKKANLGIQNLPTLVSGLQSLNAIQGINIPDLTGLSKFIEVISMLGYKKGNNAASNIGPLINGLRQLSQLGGMTFPNSDNLLSLANAFSALGRATTANAIQNIPQLATAFRQLMQTLSTAPKVSQNVINLANAMAKLSANGAKVGSASRSLNTGMQKVDSGLSRVMQRSRAISTRLVGLIKNLVLSGKSATNAGRHYETLASKVGLLYAKFWMLLRAVRALNGMIEVASHLTEVQNVVDTTFGNMSNKIEDFSKNAIKGFGMSELAAKQYASQFQAMGTAMGITGQQVANAQKLLNTRKTMEGNVVGYNKAANSMADMSIALTKLSADMASFYDISQDQVAKALQSGVMAGQTRPLMLAA